MGSTGFHALLMISSFFTYRNTKITLIQITFKWFCNSKLGDLPWSVPSWEKIKQVQQICSTLSRLLLFRSCCHQHRRTWILRGNGGNATLIFIKSVKPNMAGGRISHKSVSLWCWKNWGRSLWWIGIILALLFWSEGSKYMEKNSKNLYWRYLIPVPNSIKRITEH